MQSIARNPLPLVVFVDVDDTLIRTLGNKRMPISAAINHVQSLFSQGAHLYCWSSGGAEYARLVATEFGISNCFIAFLPKPDVLLDDQPVSNWRRLITIHPMQCETESTASYRVMIDTGSRPAG